MNDLSTSSVSLILFLAFAVFIIPFIFYLLTLQKTLQAISPENRKMPPSQVWLLFIPFFAIVWHFIVVKRISDSIKAESLVRDIELKEARPGYPIGLAMCILNCVSIFPKVFGIFGSVAALCFLVCWIIYWVKIASYKTQIINASEFRLDAESNLES